MRLYLPILAGFLFSVTILAEEPRWETLGVPMPETFSELVDNKDGPSKYLETKDILGVTVRVYDATGFLYDLYPLAPSLSEGGRALYLREANLLLLRDTPQNIEQFRRMNCGCASFSLSCELTLVSFHLPPAFQGRSLSYQELRDATGASWKIIQQLNVLSRIGERTVGSFLRGNPDATAAKTMPPEASGAIVELEPVIGPDGEALDLTYHYHFRMREGTGSPLDFTATGHVMTTIGTPEILQISIASEPELSYAVISKTIFRLPGSVPSLSRD